MRGKSAASATFLWAATAVGYGTQECTANKYTLFGVSFAGINAEETLTLGEVIKGNFTDTDTIMVVNVSGTYNQYTYITAETAEDEEIESGAGWYGEDSEKHDNDIQFKNGDAFWFFPKETVTVTIAGQVKTAWEFVAPANIYSMIANPFPSAITIGTFTYTGTDTDTIMIPNALGTYDQYTYISAETAEDEEIETGAGWYTDEFANGTTIQPNQGFWLLPKGEAKIGAVLSL